MATKRKSKKEKPLEVPEYKCPFCDKVYKREVNLIQHKCDRRDRYNNKESRTFREAYHMYRTFHEFYNIKIKKVDDPELQFVKAKLFITFWNFAEYLNTISVIDRDQFISYTLYTGIPDIYWRTNEHYKKWTLQFLRKEHPRRGIERSIMALQEWSIATGLEWNTFFEECSTERAKLFIENGKLSPWIFYIADKEVVGKLIQRFSQEDSEYLYDFIDPSVWTPLSVRYKDEVYTLRNLLKEYGL